MKRLLRSGALQATGAYLLGHYLAFALRTTRWRVHGEEHMAPHAAGAPVIVAFWHERLPLMPALWVAARGRAPNRTSGLQPHALISRHRDGRLIAAVIRRFGIGVVFGSSGRGGETRGGSAGVLRMLDLLAAGDHVAITPDGPRGPRRVAAPGVAQVAGLAHVPILPTAAQTSRRRVLPSWDRMVLPLPFGRGVIVCQPVIHVSAEDYEAALPAISAAMTDAADMADRLCAA